MTYGSLSTPTSGLRVFSASLLSALMIIMPFVHLAAAETRYLGVNPGVRGQGSESGRQAPDAGAQDKSAHNSATNLFLNAPIPKPAPEPPALLAPTITATMTDAIINDDADNKADPNPPSTEKIEYTVTISNTGTTASSVVFNDTVDPHTTLDAASVNASPLSRNDTYNSAIGNTLLEVGVTASGYPAVVVSGSVFDNDTEFLGDTFTLKAVQAVNFAGGNTIAASANGGTVTMEPDGNFSYLPPADSTTTDTFTYTITDDGPDNTLNTPDDLTSTSTVTITFPVTTKVWYVDNSYAGANGASDGRSTRPYTSLTPLNGADLDDPGDVIYVHTGSGNYTAGITMEANQQLIGNGVALVVNAITLRGIGARPTALTSGDTVSVPEISGVVIRGFNLGSTTGNAVDVTTTGGNSGGVEIAENVITGAALEGIDVNGGGTGAMTVSIHDNSVTATGNGIDIRRTAGTVNVIAFDDNQVLGSTGGIGINVVGTGATVMFDSNTGTAAFDTVSGGTTIIGASGNGVGASGLVLDNIRGDISFTDLDIFADNGTALKIDSTSPNFNAGTSTGAQIVASGSNATLFAVNGPAVDSREARINLVLSSMSSSGSGATGVSLFETSGAFNAPSGSSISIIPTTAAFFIDGNGASGATVGVTYAGTITSDTGRLIRIEDVTGTSTHSFSGLISDNQDNGGADGGESGISLSNNTGATVSFTGGLNINTTTNTAFSATGGGTITATQNNGGIVNTLSSVSNTALTVTSTNIGSSGLTFRRINAGNNTAAADPVNGILLSSTGTAGGNGGLTVTGNSSGNCGGVSNPSSNPVTSDCTGGTIQKATGTGVSLSSTKAPSLTRMYIFDNAGDGIKATTSSNVSVISSYLDSNADQTTPDESGLYLSETYGTATITNTWISNSFETDLRIENSNVTNGALTVNMSGCSIFNTGASTQAGNLFNFLGNLTSNMTLNLSNSRFDGNRVVGALTTDGIHADTSGGTMNVTVASSTFVDNFVGISMTMGGTANLKTVDYDINGNTVTGSEGTAINVTAVGGFGGDTMEGKVRNNLIGTSGVMNSGSLLGFGMDIDNESTALYTVAITNNTIREIRRFDGIFARQVVSAGTTNVTITGNIIDQIRNDQAANVFGINTAITSAGTLCANISGNTLTNIDPSGFGNLKDLRVREAAGTMNVTQATPTGAVNPAELDDANGIPGLVDVVGAPSFSQPACATVAMLNMENSDRDVVASQRTIETDTQSSWTATAQALTSIASEVSSLFESPTHSAKDAMRFDSVTQSSETRQQNELRTHHTSFDAKKARTTGEGSEQSDVRSHHARVTKLEARNSRTSAIAAPLSGEAVGPISLGTLQNGDTVIIKFQVTVNNPPDLNNPVNPLVVTQPAVATQGSVSYNDGATPQTPVLTDEVAGGAVTATETPVDLFDVDNVLASNLNPSNSGDNVTFTATITENPTQPTVNPTGTVDFIDTNNGNAVICDNVTLTAGSAQCQTALLTAGTHNIRADYSGDGNFDAKQSNIEAQVVIACVANPVVDIVGDENDADCVSGDCSLREAIKSVCSGTTITFDTAGVFATAQTITLTLGELPVTRNVTIDAPDGANHVTVSGGDASRVFNINSGKTVTIKDLTITDGLATGASFPDTHGGAIFNSGTLTLINSTVKASVAKGGAGGIYTGAGSTLNITSSTISGNSIQDPATGGGGIAVDGATATLINSTISGNSAGTGGQGGGIHNSASTTTITNCTIAENSITGGGGSSGGINTEGVGATVNIGNTIVANNVAGADPDVKGTFNSQDYNLIENVGSATIGGATANNITGQDPVIGPLANNGGPTFTHRILGNSSPAMDKGNTALTTDQRGQPRPKDNLSVPNAAGGNGDDIGAYEAPLPPNAPDLDAASDTGSSSTDNYTADNTPTFTIQGVETGAFVELLAGATVVASGTVASLCLGLPCIQLTSSMLADGPYSMTARQTVAGGLSPTSTGANIIIDTGMPGAPTIDLVSGSDSGSNTGDNITNAGTRTFDIGNTETGATVELLRDGNPVGGTITGNNGTVQLSDSTAAVSGTTYAYTARQTDSGGNQTSSAPLNVTFDNVGPTVSMSSVASNPTNTSPIPVTVLFNESVNGFTATDITPGNATVNNFAGSGANYTFDLVPSGQGTVTADISAAVAQDTAGNDNSAATQFSRTFDTDSPSANITDVTPDPRNTSVSSITIVFSEAVTGFDLADLTLTLDGGANLLTGAQTLSSGDNITWTLGNLSGITAAQGTYLLTLTAAGSGITDNGANALAGDATDSWVMDITAPTVTINQALGQSDPTSGSPINFTVVFSESVTGFTNTDVTFSGAGATTATVTQVAPNDGTTYNVAISGMNADGTVQATVNVNAAQDGVGNNSAASTSTDNQVTFINLITINIHDAKVAEPASPNTIDMVFTVSLSAPAPAAGVDVDFTTSNGSATFGTCGNPGADYVLTSGTVSFTGGQQVQTINVSVCSDAVADDGETFTVTLSSPTSPGVIGDGTATGTITANTPGTVLISELRTSGPGGAGDDFVEIYNNSNSPVDISGYGLFKMAAGDCYGTPVLIGAVPGAPGSNTTVIPARGHYLFVGSAYSLANYGGTGAANGNLILSSDIETDANVGLFSTSDVTAISSVNRLDAVGFGANVLGACNLLREPSNLPPIAANPTLEHSYFRKMCDWLQGQGCTVPGIPKDTNNNADDFWLADTGGSAATGRLGAPGPENLASPIRRDSANNPGSGGINVFLLDGTVGSGAAPNRKRDGFEGAGSTPTQYGTMTLRYRVTNTTGGNVTRLRYRIVDISTAIQPAGPTADLRALTSSIESSPANFPQVHDSVTCAAANGGNPATPCNVTVQATTLEQPPTQAVGGGYNSTLSSGTITATPGSELAPGASILINFKLGVQKTGTFRFYIIVEALP